MRKIIAALLGIGGALAAAPAGASVTEQAALEHARSAGTIEALEAFAHQFPRTALLGALKAEYAKYECAQGIQWRCGHDRDHQPSQHRSQYGG